MPETTPYVKYIKAGVVTNAETNINPPNITAPIMPHTRGPTFGRS